MIAASLCLGSAGIILIGGITYIIIVHHKKEQAKKALEAQKLAEQNLAVQNGAVQNVAVVK